jgi:membrane protein implicated in regulation of membrane protease activity
LIKYILLNLPAAILLVLLLVWLRSRFHIPGWVFWGAIGLWAAKDAALFPLVWRAYESKRSEEGRMVGEEGFAAESLAPSGYINVRGELWKAVLTGDSAPVQKGAKVKVCGQEGLTLIVTPGDTD